MHEGGAYDRFYPACGATWFDLTLTGAKCPLAGNVVALRSETYGEADYATGVLAVDQPLGLDATEEDTLGNTLTSAKTPPRTGQCA